MPIVTDFTKLVGVEVPVVQGGMHHVGNAEMAAAVSNAGGLGIITSITIIQYHPNDPLQGLRDEIRKCRGLTSKPFGVNVTLLPILGKVDMVGIVRVICEEGIKVVETAGRTVPKELMAMFKESGIIVMHKCTSIRHALSAEKAGVDVISMDGFDCGGHPGEDDVGNWVLLPKAATKLKIPFIASGGCANGAQLAAALAFGASGMNMGTRFMATAEAPILDPIKQALVKADERDTTLIFRTHNNTERVFKNETAMKVREIEAQHPGDFKKILPLVKGDNYKKSFQESGDAQSSCWSCGQSIGLIDDVPTCQKLLQTIVSDCERILSRQASFLSKL